MRTTVILLACIFAACQAELLKSEDIRYPSSCLERLKSLKKFVKLVEQKELNVSVIASTSEKFKNGNLKETIAISVTFPVKEGPISKVRQLTSSDARVFIKYASEDKLAAQAHIGVSAMWNNKHAIPQTESLDILTKFDYDTDDLIYEKNSTGALVTFLEDNGMSTRVLFGNIPVEVVNSTFTNKENTIIQEILEDTQLMFEDDDLPEAIAASLEKIIPEKTWQVAKIYDTEANHYLSAEQWGIFKVSDDIFLIYSIQ